MNKYLLLRSNKQTGPYTAADLQQMGLKPYDLVWVDGKSAAWRYPGEIDELKPFAPAVEEQPYDRFYKKSSPSQHAHEIIQSKQQVADTVRSEQKIESATDARYQPPVDKAGEIEKEPAPAEPKQDAAINKTREYKRVFVTLPAGMQQKNNDKPVSPQPQQVTAETAVEKVPEVTAETAAPQKPRQPVGEKTPQNIVQTKNHDPLDSSNEKAAELTDSANSELFLQEYYSRKAALSTDNHYPRNRTVRSVPVAALVIGFILLACGIAIGIAINSGGSNDQVAEKTIDNPQIAVPVLNTSKQGGDEADDVPEYSEPLARKAQQQVVTPEKKTTPVDKPGDAVATREQWNDPAAGKEVASKPGGAKPDAVIPQEKESITRPSAPDLAKLIDVSSNDYEVGPFGGISRLNLTVKNSSDIDLNLVVVQVDYLKVNKEVFKTENIYFRDVAANSEVTVEAPRSTRGNKVSYKVTMINSKDHLFHAAN